MLDQLAPSAFIHEKTTTLPFSKQGPSSYASAVQRVVPQQLDSDQHKAQQTLAKIGIIHMIHSEETLKRKATALVDWQAAPIFFPPLKYAMTPEPVVITARIANCQVSRVYTDTGSAVDVMYEHCFLQLPAHVQSRIQEPVTPLSSYTNDCRWPVGRITMTVTLGEHPQCRTEELEFVIVRAPSRFNVLLGRTTLYKFGAITSTIHGSMKFPTPAGVATICTTKTELPLCAQISKPPPRPLVLTSDGMVAINPLFPEQKVKVGLTLSAPSRLKLCELLAANIDIFAWQDSEMTGVPRSIAEHKLNANPSITPVR